MYGILRLCSKRFQNEIKIIKYLNIVDLLYFVIIMCLKLFVLTWFLALRETRRTKYIWEEKVWKHAIDPLELNARKSPKINWNWKFFSKSYLQDKFATKLNLIWILTRNIDVAIPAICRPNATVQGRQAIDSAQQRISTVEQKFKLSGADKCELDTTALKFISILIGRAHNGYS